MTNILLYLGDNPILTLTAVSSASGQPVDLTGATLEMRLPKKDKTSELVITNATYAQSLTTGDQSTAKGQVLCDLSKVSGSELLLLRTGRGNRIRLKVTFPGGTVINFVAPILDVIDPSTQA